MSDAPIDRYMLTLTPPLQRIFDEVTASAARGDWIRASEGAVRLRDAAPRSIPVLMLASLVMLKVDRYRDAHSFALEAANPPIDVPEMLLQAVRSLRRFEEPEALQRLVAASQWRDIPSSPLMVELALHLGSSGLYVLALQCLDHATKLDPHDANTHYLRGLFEMFSGHADASIAALRRAVSIRRGLANAHWLLSMQGDLQSAEGHITEMMGELRTVPPDSEAYAYLCYSLHHRLDAVGRHHEAWRALELGRAARRRTTKYDRKSEHALFQALKDMVLPEFGPEPTSSGGTGLIFIVGMYRSGTTLIERVLAGHPDVADGGETYQFSASMRDAVDHDCAQVVDLTIVSRAPFADFGIVRQRMHAYAGWRSAGRRWLTEKLPSNFLNLGFILHALPEAKILHLRRDPVETCFSNLRTIFTGAAPYACDQDDLADYYLQYQGLMTHWHAMAPGRILDVDYAAFVGDPGSGARRIMEHCGLTYLPEALDIDRQGGVAATASAAHVRKGILKNRGEAWKPYAQQLQPMIRGLRAAYDT